VLLVYLIVIGIGFHFVDAGVMRLP
jgi:hypothetical protein